MIHIIITSYNEPKSTLRAVNTFLKQKIKDIKIIVCDPFPEVKSFIKKNVKDKRVSFFLDSGEGKSYALNLLLNKIFGNEDDIIIFTDGDVYASDNSLSEVMNAFNDENVGCVTCKIMSIDDNERKYGYWSHLLFSGANKLRKHFSDEGKFFECSGYFFAIKNKVVKEFPMDVSEDSVIPYLFWKKNYKIKYLDNVEVYVKNPDNWKDWKNQKIRNIKGHENLNKIYPGMPRTKSFFNEIKYGFFHVLSYPKTIKEMFWTIELLFARLFIYIKAFYELRKKKVYSDGWRETEIQSTKPLD